jgi:hypothetical protein
MYLGDAITCLRQAIDNQDATYIGFAKYKIEEAEREIQDRRRIVAQHVAKYAAAKPGCACRDCMVARSTVDGGEKHD